MTINLFINYINISSGKICIIKIRLLNYSKVSYIMNPNNERHWKTQLNSNNLLSNIWIKYDLILNMKIKYYKVMTKIQDFLIQIWKSSFMKTPN